MLSRRQFLKLSALAGAGLAVPWKLLTDASPAYAFSQSTNLQKFIQPLRRVGADIPVAVPDTVRRGWWQPGVTHYTIEMGQFTDQLHPSLAGLHIRQCQDRICPAGDCCCAMPPLIPKLPVACGSRLENHGVTRSDRLACGSDRDLDSFALAARPCDVDGSNLLSRKRPIIERYLVQGTVQLTVPVGLTRTPKVKRVCAVILRERRRYLLLQHPVDK